MNKARLVVLAIAAIAAGGAAMLLLGRQTPQKPVVVTVAAPAAADAIDVLVANADIATGRTITANDLRWQPWPKESVSDKLVRKADNPKVMDEVIGAIARYPFAIGEPIRLGRIVRTGGKGYMAAMLTPGMRGIAIDVTAESSAAGFILPNDQVDVLLTRRISESGTAVAPGAPTHSTQTILQSVRVLAVDATVDDPNNAKNMIGRVVTLELTPPQAEILAQARQMGTLSLALRSVADAGSMPLSGTTDDAPNGRTGPITVIRFGRASTAAGAP